MAGIQMVEIESHGRQTKRFHRINSSAIKLLMSPRPMTYWQEIREALSTRSNIIRILLSLIQMHGRRLHR